MRNICIFITIILFSGLTNYGQNTPECTVEIPESEQLVDGTNINPGDIICILAGNKDYLLFRDIHGTEENPVTIINKDGPVVIDTDHSYGVKFDNCKHIIFSGTGISDVDYGFQVKRVSGGAGVSIDNQSTNFEVSNIEISYTAIAAFYAKTEPYQGDCDDLITREKFTMYDLKVHDCYIHHIADEGFYIGSSKFTGQTIYSCNDTVVLPHVIKGVEIYNNILDRTGWDGIQVSSAIEDCSVHDNIVTDDSFLGFEGQMSGILIGGGSVCDCFNNSIFNGKGDGIDIFGMGNMMIYNNLIVNPGRSFYPGQPDKFKHGIYVGHVVTNPGSDVKIYNNTIISPKSNGIKFKNSEVEYLYIKNNLITNPGQLLFNPSTAYLNLEETGNLVELSNNYLVNNNSNPKFIDPENNDYDLLPNSPAINYGTSLTSEGITFDILNRPRPFHTYFDAGAYECHDPTAGLDKNVNITTSVYPNPAGDFLVLKISVRPINDMEVSIVSMEGKTLMKQNFNNYDISDDGILFNTENLNNGNYILNIKSDNYIENKLIIILK